MNKQQISIVILVGILLLGIIIFGVGVSVNESGGSVDADNFDVNKYLFINLLKSPVSFFTPKLEMADILPGNNKFIWHVKSKNKKYRKAELCMTRRSDKSGSDTLIITYSLQNKFDIVKMDDEERTMLSKALEVSCTLSIGSTKEQSSCKIVPILRFPGKFIVVDPPSGIRVLCNNQEFANY